VAAGTMRSVKLTSWQMLRAHAWRESKGPGHIEAPALFTGPVNATTSQEIARHKKLQGQEVEGTD
jgi:hypothetical protein